MSSFPISGEAITITACISAMPGSERHQAPLLNGLLAVGVPEASAIEAAASAVTDPTLRSVRRTVGDLAVGVELGLQMRKEQFANG